MPVDKEINLDDIIIDTSKNNTSITIEEKIKAQEKQEYNNSIKKVETFWTIFTYLLPVILFILIIIERTINYAKLSKINNNLEQIKELLEDSPLNNSKKDD